MRRLQSEYNHINELDKANIKSHNYRCSIYLIQFDLYYEAFETVPCVTPIGFFSKIKNDDATLCYAAIVTLRNTI